MKKTFSLKKLQELVEPHDLHDVLVSLMENGLVEEYTCEYSEDYIELIIPKDVEIREVMLGFQDIAESGRKKVLH
jgi:hypothetical protein